MRLVDLKRVSAAVGWAERTVRRNGHTVTLVPQGTPPDAHFGRCVACHSTVTVEWGTGRVHGNAVRGMCAHAGRVAA